jgi:hypothetical protein
VVDVDPLDPFSAARDRGAPRWGGGGGADGDADKWEDGTDEDWLPLAALMGVAGFMWLASVLGNMIPATTPVVGL